MLAKLCPKSCIPASTFRGERAQVGGWGFGNQVVSGTVAIPSDLEATARGRQGKYRTMRATSAYKLDRAARKRERQKSKHYHGVPKYPR